MPIARESQVVVVGLSIIMPTTKQWGKVGVGLEFGRFIIIIEIDIKLINHFINTQIMHDRNIIEKYLCDLSNPYSLGRPPLGGHLKLRM